MALSSSPQPNMSMTQQPVLRRTLRGSAAASLFVLTLGAAAQTAPPAAVAASKRTDTNGDGKTAKQEPARAPGHGAPN
jgi:hypothetical protein